jgi:hypothetical protein
MTNQFPDATKKVLSPAAQAVLDAYWTLVDSLDRDASHEEMLAAALRAAADQVVPATTTPWNSTLFLTLSTPEVRAKLLAIADELEGAK